MRTALVPLAVIAGITVVFSGIIGAASSTAPTRSEAAAADSAAVAKIVGDYHNALSRGDSARALQLLAPDAVILESGGIETRAEYRSHHLGADMAYARAVTSERGPVRVTIAGNTAWTASTSTAKGTFNGRSINSVGAESMVLTKASAGWTIRAIHWSSRTRRPAS